MSKKADPGEFASESADLRGFPQDLRRLIAQNRVETLTKYKRLNPWYEDLAGWTDKGTLWFGHDRNVTIYESTTLVGDVEIGEHSWIGPFCSLDGSGRLRIGESCSISAGVHILTHDTVRWALSGGSEPYEYGEVSIGRRSFIGTNAVVTRGVILGELSVVGAGAVVTKSFPSRSIVGGVPAKLIGRVTGDEANIKLEYLSSHN